MSIDTYFCFCCLSTNELTGLYNSADDINYAKLLKEYFLIQPSQEEYEDDSYICSQCAAKMREVQTFRDQVFETLNILQVNGLIKMDKIDGNYIISKVINLFDEEKYIGQIEDLKCFDVNKVPDLNEPQTIKIEDIEKNTLPQIKIMEGAQIINTFIHNTPDVLLGSEKRITVTKNRCKKEIKREPQYEVTDDFKCKLCSMVLPNRYVYHTHMNQHYPNHICEACGKGFLTEKRLKRHMSTHKTGLFRCRNCDAEFSNYNTMNSHRQRKHGSVYLYKCPYCTERFPTFNRRALHLSEVHAQPTDKYNCRICKKKFLLAGNLSSHIRNKHQKVKRYFCQECNAGFFQKQELASHMVVHTGVNQFQCGLCLKRYPRKKALNVHMRIHTGEKRFGCDVCGKRFIQKCTLLAHLKTHSGKKDKVDRESEKKL